MKKNYDELINKYLDNELNPAELEQFSAMLDNDEEAVKNLKAMKLVEHSVRKIEFDDAPQNTTYNIMRKIAVAPSAKRSNWFFWIVVSVFLLGIAIVSYVTIQQYQPPKEGIGTEKTVTAVKDFIGDQTKSLSTIFKGSDVKLIGAVITLLLIITGYFVLESHRSFKNKLKSAHH
jgi:H+/Cl- antiporter ClcA